LRLHSGPPVSDIRYLADGRILIGGNFSRHNGTARPGVARLLSNGDLDLTFVPATGPAYRIWPLTDGRVLILTRHEVRRLLSNGQLDATFQMDTSVRGRIFDMLRLPDGRILIVGRFTVSTHNATAVPGIACLLPDGQLDPNFQPTWVPFSLYPGSSAPVRSWYAVASYSDGRFVVGGPYHAFRFLPNGHLDTTFRSLSFNSGVEKVLIQPDGKVIVGGCFTAYGDSTGRHHLVRLMPDGQLDGSFQVGIGVGGSWLGVWSLYLAAGGKIYVGGWFSHFDGQEVWSLVRLHPNGKVDSSFRHTLTGYPNIDAMAEAPDGSLLVGGYGCQNLQARG